MHSKCINCTLADCQWFLIGFGNGAAYCIRNDILFGHSEKSFSANAKMHRSKCGSRTMKCQSNVRLFEGRTMLRNMHEANGKCRDKTDYIQFAATMNQCKNTQTHTCKSRTAALLGCGYCFSFALEICSAWVRRIYRSFAFTAGFACTFEITCAHTRPGWGE